MKKILFLIGLLVLLVGCVVEPESKKELSEMDCEELTEELSNKPYHYIDSNELYIRNIIGIMQLKNCELT